MRNKKAMFKKGVGKFISKQAI